jgi:hypothetical protein
MWAAVVQYRESAADNSSSIKAKESIFLISSIIFMAGTARVYDWQITRYTRRTSAKEGVVQIPPPP